MTRQQMFNTAYHGLAAQGFEKSMVKGPIDDKEFCAYRGSNSRRCALGYLIPDTIYTKEFEGHSIGVLFETNLQLYMKAFDVKDHEFLGDLQACHDTNYTPMTVKAALHTFAHHYNLSIPPLPLSPAVHENVICPGEPVAV